MISLKQYLTTGLDLFEEGYKKTRCRYKIDGVWHRARINLDKGIVYDADGKTILRRCAKWLQ